MLLSRLRAKVDSLNSRMATKINQKKEKQRMASLRREEEPTEKTEQERPMSSKQDGSCEKKFKCLYPGCGVMFGKQCFLDTHIKYNKHQIGGQEKNTEIEAKQNELR